MTIALRRVWTREEFLDWVEGQERRFEYNGFEPVAMTGGTFGHSAIHGNVLFALRSRLRGSACRAVGPDAGVATVGNAVRYPDVLVTRAIPDAQARLTPGVVVVCEVVSPSSEREDKVTKVLEYGAVPSILHYVILESERAAAIVLSRADGDADWSKETVEGAGLIDFPELGLSMPLAEFYEDIAF